MKLIYCHADVYNPGGMERVLLNKLRWWVQRGGYEVMLVTTDQHGRPPFYDFPPEVRMVDLGINYKDDNGRNPIFKTFSYLRKRRKHKKALTELLMREKADAVISLYPSESSFIPDIQDGSVITCAKARLVSAPPSPRVCWASTWATWPPSRFLPAW